MAFFENFSQRMGAKPSEAKYFVLPILDKKGLGDGRDPHVAAKPLLRMTDYGTDRKAKDIGLQNRDGKSKFPCEKGDGDPFSHGMIFFILL